MANSNNDVFRSIDMSGGPDTCWAWKGGWGGRESERRPYFSAEGRRWIAYRLVWFLVHGKEPPSSVMLLHSCDNGGAPVGCCNPRHLREGSHSENTADMVSRGRHGLPANTIKAIKKLLRSDQSHAEIAELYGVSRETITAINGGRVYAHIKEEDNESSSEE